MKRRSWLIYQMRMAYEGYPRPFRRPANSNRYRRGRSWRIKHNRHSHASRAGLDGGRAKMGSEMKSGSSLGLCVTQVTFNRCRTQAVYRDVSRRGRTPVLDAFPPQYLSLSRSTRKWLHDGRPM